jgi:hypothetical protein
MSFNAQQCLALVAALALASCAPPAPSQTAQAPAAQVSPPPSPAATPKPGGDADAGEGETDFLVTEDFVAGGMRIVPVVLREKDERRMLEVKVSYPQIADPKTPQQRDFNRHVRKTVEGDLDDFRDFCAENVKDPDGEKRRADFSFATRYLVQLATPELLSVELTEVSFAGYLNSDWDTHAFNYDLKAGRMLRLPDLFRRGSKFLEVIAAYCVEEVRRRNDYCGAPVDEDWLRRGSEPKPKNYEGWSLTGDGLQITFAEYQIAPGCAGLISVVVPYERLREVLKPDGTLARLAAPRPAAAH